MDSLAANYASSDEDDGPELPPPPPKQLKPPASQVKLNPEAEEEGFNSKSQSEHGGILSSLPPPKSSLFNSLPPPKSLSIPNPSPRTNFEERREESNEHDEQVRANSKPSPSSLFTSLPPPKLSSSVSSKPKRVVQFKPPTMMNPYPVNDDDEEDDEGEKERQRKKLKESVSTSSAMSFLSSIPAPRHSATLGALGTGRRSMLETGFPASAESIDNTKESGAMASNVESGVGFIGDQSRDMSYDYSSHGLGGESHGYYGGYDAARGDSAGFVNASSVNTAGNDVGINSKGSSEVWSGEMNYDYSSTYSVSETYASSDGSIVSDGVNVSSGTVDYSYANVEDVQYRNPGVGYVDYANNTQYEDNWANVATLPEVPDVGNELQVPGKRRRKDAPPQIIEVKQDELMKNRPREDQVKLTGIAFGPAYQPTSSKGKPTKLHKRKHQIGSLYFDMRQKEMELAERRAQGFQTKAQTQAKYGW